MLAGRFGKKYVLGKNRLEGNGQFRVSEGIRSLE